MKNIIPKDTRYIPLTQQKSCCAPASISMVMYKLGLPLMPQELLGYYLGLVVSKDDQYLFWSAKTGKKPRHGYGTRVGLKKYNPNQVFKKLGVPLRMTIHPIAKFKTKKEFISFILNRIKKDEDILTCFHNGILNGNDKNGGHVCVVDRIYPAKNKIRLIDPSPNQPKWREVEIDRLKRAMELHPTNGGGFWELERI